MELKELLQRTLRNIESVSSAIREEKKILVIKLKDKSMIGSFFNFCRFKSIDEEGKEITDGNFFKHGTKNLGDIEIPLPDGVEVIIYIQANPKEIGYKYKL